MGVVYYANYFVWFEVARADLLRSLGWTYREMEHAGVSLPVIEAHCDYHRSARYACEGARHRRCRIHRIASRDRAPRLWSGGYGAGQFYGLLPPSGEGGEC